MKHYKKSQQGFAAIEAIIVIIVLVTLGGVGYLVATRANKNPNTNNTSTTTPTPTPTQEKKTTSKEIDTSVVWDNGQAEEWRAIYGTPPACDDPYKLASPADFNKATSILYPGQTRSAGEGEQNFSGLGGNYKPHGGVRYDGLKPTDVKVVSPIDGYVFRGSRYLINGETQYTFDIIDPCGMMVRLGHLLTLSDTFQTIADKLPPAQEGDSRSEKFEKGIIVHAGDSIATSVGFAKTNNTFFDFGVYDLRKRNTASQSVEFQNQHTSEKELSWHALCWFDLLSSKDAATVKALPSADKTNGKNSDYCK